MAIIGEYQGIRILATEQTKLFDVTEISRNVMFECCQLPEPTIRVIAWQHHAGLGYRLDSVVWRGEMGEIHSGVLAQDS